MFFSNDVVFGPDVFKNFSTNDSIRQRNPVNSSRRKTGWN